VEDKDKGKAVSRRALRRLAVQSTRASASLEQRTIPETYVRTPGVETFLARRDRAS
jgi:hypothetical protein